MNIEYSVSLHPARSKKDGMIVLGKWAKQSPDDAGRITLYLPHIWLSAMPGTAPYEHGITDVDNFTSELVRTILIETICLERSGQRLRIKNRCSPCKVERVADNMLIDLLPIITEPVTPLADRIDLSHKINGGAEKCTIS